MKIYKTYLYAFGILAGSLLNASCIDMLTEDPNSYYESNFRRSMALWIWHFPVRTTLIM